MYKRFTIDELKTIQNNFAHNLFGCMKKEQCITTTDFFRKIFKEGTDIYYCNRTDVALSCSRLTNENFTIRDEKEKIEIILDEQGKKDIHNLMKNYVIKKERQVWQKTIEQILIDAFSEGFYTNIDDKPYMVYDIETTIADSPRNAEFLLGYAMYPIEGNKMHYEYISKDGLDDFVQKMIDFDGYIIGYNNIRFDNPVCIYNTNRSQEDLDIINQKTLDLFVFLCNTTGKRLGLNKVATALVAVGKTLESGAEGEVLWKKYQETGDLKFLEEFKKYCKNDVRMTALVLLYLLHYKKIFIEGDEKEFDLDDLLQKSNNEIKEEKPETNTQNVLF